MKKKILIIGSIVVVLIALLLVVKPWGNKLFKNLSEDKISSVSVELLPPNKTIDLTQNQIINLVNTLQTVVIYNEVPIEPLAGQAVIYRITKVDGTVMKVEPFGRLIQIDGVRYKTKYEPSEDLNRMANEIVSGK